MTQVAGAGFPSKKLRGTPERLVMGHESWKWLLAGDGITSLPLTFRFLVADPVTALE